MGWRRITEADCKPGVCWRMTNMVDTPFNGGTILKVVESTIGKSDGLIVTLARPSVYASSTYPTNQPLLSCEVFTIFVDSDYNGTTEVYETSRGDLRKMLVKSE